MTVHRTSITAAGRTGRELCGYGRATGWPGRDGSFAAVSAGSSRCDRTGCTPGWSRLQPVRARTRSGRSSRAQSAVQFEVARDCAKADLQQRPSLRRLVIDAKAEVEPSARTVPGFHFGPFRLHRRCSPSTIVCAQLSVQDRSRIRRGSACLSVHGNPVECLEGSCWTDRDSKGEMTFDRKINARHTPVCHCRRRIPYGKEASSQRLTHWCLIAQPKGARTFSSMQRHRVELQCHDANGAAVPLRNVLPALLSGERVPEDYTLSLRPLLDDPGTEAP